MTCASVLASVLHPTQRMADSRDHFDLEMIIPEKIGDWQREPVQSNQIVDPQLQQTVDVLYSTVFAHSYVNPRGDRVMVSIAYGEEQTKQSQVHLPEVCYPAQGFSIEARHKAEISTLTGNIPVMRMIARGGGRVEPITYWIRLGDVIVRGGFEQKIETVREGLAGRVPDGLLFRVSSLSINADAAYVVHQQFIEQLLSVVKPDYIPLLIGNNFAN